MHMCATRRPLPLVLMLLGTVVTRAGKASGTDDPAERRSPRWAPKGSLEKLNSKLKHARCSELQCQSNKRGCHSAKVCVRMRRLLRERRDRTDDSMFECAGPRANFSANRRRCEHKPLWPRVVAREYAAASLVFVVGALAASGGIGGGGLFVPVLNLMLRFDPHTCTALSQSLICGAAVRATACAPRRHAPRRRAPYRRAPDRPPLPRLRARRSAASWSTRPRVTRTWSGR